MLVKESIQFQRKRDPASSLAIGKYSPEEIKKEVESFVKLLGQFGIEANWSYVKTQDGYKIYLESITSARRKEDKIDEMFLLTIFYLLDREKIMKNVPYYAEIVVDQEGPWFLSYSHFGAEKVHFFTNPMDLLKEMLTYIYKESEKWSYLEIMKKTIKLLDE